MVPLSCFLLILCKSSAQQTESFSDFPSFVASVEQAYKVNPNQALDLLNEKSAIADSLVIEQRLIYFYWLSKVYLRQSRYQLSKSIADKALQLALELSSPSITTSKLLFIRGQVSFILGNHKVAKADYISGHEVATSLGNKKISAMGLILLGGLECNTQDYERALVMVNDALSVANELKDDELLGDVNQGLGCIYRHLNERQKSLTFYKKSYKYYISAGMQTEAFTVLYQIGLHYGSTQKFDLAIPLFKELIENKNNVLDEVIAMTYHALALSLVRQDDKNAEVAYQYLLMADPYINKSESIAFYLQMVRSKGFVLYFFQRYNEALLALDESLELLKRYQGDEQTMSFILEYRPVLIMLKSLVYYDMNNFLLAYQAQEEFLKYTLLPENNNIEAIEDVRIRYESEQAQLEIQLLEQKEAVQVLKIKEMEQELNQRQVFIGLFTFLTLIFVLLFILGVKGQRNLLCFTRTDTLTGINNRKSLMQLLAKHFERCQRENKPMSLLMLDIDDFKKINDKFGYHVGDEVLKKIASLGRDLMRENDDIGRFGSKAFIGILPDTDREQAVVFGERFRQSVDGLDWQYLGLDNVSLSIVVVCNRQGQFDHCDLVLKQAEKLMYQAKVKGKEQVYYE